MLVPVDRIGDPLEGTASLYVYQGFIRSASWATKAGDTSSVLSVYTFLLQAVRNSLSAFVVETPPGFSDIRPLLRPSHGTAISLQPSVRVRYSGRISLSNYGNLSSAVSNFPKDRRYS